jgi:5'-deoxynucleotidase YfbR-like HD superfamily hydrolase
MEDLLKKSDEEILEIAKRLRVAYGLKRTIRYSATRDMSYHHESVAEHVFALFFLAEYFLRVEPSARSLNKEKVYDILLFHDFGEIKHGDVSTYSKTEADEEREREAAKEIFAALPEPLNILGHASWEEYEVHKTPEARFAVALDKFEPIFEVFDPINERSIKNLKVTFDMHVGNKYKAAKDFPVMMRFLKVMSEDLRARGVFWGKE